jgi:hypothetical protein
MQLEPILHVFVVDNKGKNLESKHVDSSRLDHHNFFHV